MLSEEARAWGLLHAFAVVLCEAGEGMYVRTELVDLLHHVILDVLFALLRLMSLGM